MIRTLFFRGAFRLYLYCNCGSTVLRLLTKPVGCRFSQVRYKIFIALAGCETLWFIPMLRYRADAITVSAAASMRHKKTAAQQENGSGFFGFVAAYCGLRSSAISVTSKEKRDGKKNQMNNFCYLSDDVIITHYETFVKRYLRIFYQINLKFL